MQGQNAWMPSSGMLLRRQTLPEDHMISQTLKFHTEDAQEVDGTIDIQLYLQEELQEVNRDADSIGSFDHASTVQGPDPTHFTSVDQKVAAGSQSHLPI
jgi:hypothetical protein